MSDIHQTEYQFIRDMDKFITLAIACAVLIMSNGCHKLPSDFHTSDGSTDTEEQVSARIAFSVASPLSAETKSFPSGTDDDAIDRIDIFSFDETGWTAGHHTIKAEDGSVLDLKTISFTDNAGKGCVKTYLIMANLSEDTADYIRYLDDIDINRYPEGIVPWSANCRPGLLIMARTLPIEFTNDTELNIRLYRYMSRFEIGTITADFNDQEYFKKDIQIRDIVFVNSWDFIRITQRHVTEYDNDPRDIFGAYASLPASHTFGGISKGFSNPNTIDIDVHSHYDGEYCPGDWGADGVLTQKFKYLYNNNFKLEAHELNLECPESLKQVSQHSFGSGEARLCPSSVAKPGQASVNMVFYSLPTYFAVSTTQPCSWEGQDRTHKLVISVSIDGELFFYPIRLDFLHPNMIYRIRNISLRGEPSLYSNFYEWSLTTHTESILAKDILGHGGIDNSKATGKTDNIQSVLTDAVNLSTGQEFQHAETAEWRINGNVAETDNLTIY